MDKKQKLIILSAILILAGFGLAKEALAGYYSQGTLTSTNLLSGKTVSSIDSFWYNASSIPSGASLKVQFSQDNSTWKNSSGTIDGWDNCTTTGGATISLSTLGWSGANFYYKMQFNSNAAQDATPGLEEIRVNYASNLAPTVTTQAATDVTSTSCIGNGNITDTGGANATRRGFAYMVGTSGDPTTANSVVYDDGSFGIGAYTKSITGLSPVTSYRVRAYAVNSAGTGYGATVQVTTLLAFTFTVKMADECDCSAVCGDEEACSECYGSDGTDGYCCSSDGSLVCHTGSCIPHYPPSGEATPPAVDTGEEEGVMFNSIMWQGTEPDGTDVRLQLATSNCPNGETNYPTCTEGTWEFFGKDCTVVSYYDPPPDTPMEIGCYTSYNDGKQRHYRFKIFLDSDPTLTITPSVGKVIVNYSP